MRIGGSSLILALIGTRERSGVCSAIERALRKLENALAEEVGVLARDEGVWDVIIPSVILRMMRNKLNMMTNTQTMRICCFRELGILLHDMPLSILLLNC
jgi:hypothetical protein